MSYGELGRVFSSRLAWPGIRKIILVAGVKDALGLGGGLRWKGHRLLPVTYFHGLTQHFLL